MRSQLNRATTAANRVHERPLSAERDSITARTEAQAAEREAENLRHLSSTQLAQSAHLASHVEAASRRVDEPERRSETQVQQAARL